MSSPRIGRFAVAGLVAVSAAGLAACNPVGPPPPPPPPPTTTTTAPAPASTPCASSSPAIVCSQFNVDGLARKFYTHVSAQPAPAGGRPVMFFFHGDGGTGNWNMSSIYAQTDPDGAVVIQMDGPNNIPSLNRGGTAWSFYMDGTGPDDVNFTSKVLDGVIDGSLVPGADIDPHRVYAVGSSRGGFMVDTLAVDARTADRFAAVVSLSGNFYCEAGDVVCDARVKNGGLSTSAAVMHIHGNSDGVVDAPGHLPSPVTGTITWPWPLGSMSYGHGCSGDYAYASQLAPMGGKNTYEYRPAGGCAVDYRLVLLQNGGHGIAGWESYGWNYLKVKTSV